MNQCKDCGASVPDNSKFCLQCGAEFRSATPAAPKKDLDFLQPALIGGAALGVLSAIPYIRGLNIICCLWVVAGGVVATVLLNKQRPGQLTYGDGAFAGLMAGLIGALVSTIVSIPVRMLETSPEALAQLQRQMDQLPPNFPSVVKDFILQAAQPGISIPLLMFGLVVGAIIDSIFATIGATATVAVLNRKKTD